jgi:predicted nucleotidyltransferase
MSYAGAVNLSAPLRDIVSGTRGALLQVLARLERPVTRRQLAATAGVNAGHGSSVIEDLISSGLVTEMKVGRASLVSLNRGHMAAQNLVALAGLRGELIRRLRDRMKEWPDLSGAWLFGSVARGDSHPDSDIDIVIVATDLDSLDLHQRLTRLHADVAAWTGNELQVVEHSPSSWTALKASKNPLLEQIRIDGIPLIDTDTSLLERLK